MSVTSRRVSVTQLMQLWEFLTSHREIAVGFNKSTQAREHSKTMWERVAVILNSTGEGATKSGSEWSKYWVDYKAKLKRKNRAIMDSQRRTGGGPATNLELSDIERKFLSILGQDYGSGIPGVRVELPEPAGSQVYQDVAGPSNVIVSESPATTATDEPMYLIVPFSDEHQQSEEHEIPQLLHPNTTPDTGNELNIHVSTPLNPGPSPSRRGTTGHGARRRLVLSENPLQSPRQTTEQERRRRRRQQGQHMSAADARERLVRSSEARAQAELANSRSMERAVTYLGELVSILKQTSFPTDALAENKWIQATGRIDWQPSI